MDKQYEHAAAIAKIEAFRQAKSMQAGVECTNSRISINSFSLAAPRSWHLVFTMGDNIKEMQYVVIFRQTNQALYDMYIVNNYLCTGGVNTAISPNTQYTVDIVEQADTQTLYINSELISTRTVSPLLDYSNIILSYNTYSFKGVFNRLNIFNHALSAADIALLYNNGDPMGYVMPASAKYLEMSYHSDFSQGADGWRAMNDSSTSWKDGMLEITSTTTSYQITRTSGLIPTNPAYYHIKIRLAEPLPEGVFVHAYPFSIREIVRIDPDTDSTLLEGICIPTKGSLGLSNNSFVYFYNVPENRVVKVLTIDIKPIGCIAEYLPQNLMQINWRGRALSYHSDFSKDMDGWRAMNDSSTSWKDGMLKLSSTSASYQMTRASASLPNGGVYYKVKIDLAEPLPEGAYVRVYPFSEQEYVNIYPDANSRLIEGICIPSRGNSGLSYNSYVYFFHMPEDSVLHVKSIKIEPIDYVADSWLDSARQLPLNDAYLPPLIETIGGYDLIANNTPEILYQRSPTVLISVDLMNEGVGNAEPYVSLYFSSDQTDATYTRLNGKIVANIGSYSSWTGRPIVSCRNFIFVPGRYYRVSVKYSLIHGEYRTIAFGDWATDEYRYTGESLHTEPGSYEYVTPLLKAGDNLVTYVRPTIYFGTSRPNSELSIDEFIIEEYA